MRLQQTNLKAYSLEFAFPAPLEVDPEGTPSEDAHETKFTCPGLRSAFGARVFLSPSYYSYILCRCTAGKQQPFSPTFD